MSELGPDDLPTEPFRPPLDPTTQVATTAAVGEPRAQVRVEGATVLFTGRMLLPLLPEDPERIGPFKLQRRVAGGQHATDKFVARDGRGYCFLKVLQPSAGADEITAFAREARIAQRVTDRHRLATYIDSDPGGAGRPPFLALSFVPGRHLGELLERATLGEQDLLALAASLVEALDELADCGIIHADLKPANVIMRDGDYPVVVDFGSAVPLDTTTVWEAAFATNGYAAPEFLERRATNASTDVYAWGAVLLTAATGELPAEAAATREAQLQRVPEPLRSLVADALAADPARRPTVAYARKHLQRGRALTAHPPTPRTARTEPQPGAAVAQPRALPARGRGRLRELTLRAAALTVWQYRIGIGLAAVAGWLVGLVAGVVLRQLWAAT